MTSWRDAIPVHPVALKFPRMKGAELKELGEDIKRHGLLQPIIIFRDETGADSVLDGVNRLDAMAAVNIPFELRRNRSGWEIWILDDDLEIEFSNVFGVEVLRDVDPATYVLSANAHRRHLKRAEKRAKIAELLKLAPNRSDLSIAEQVGVHNETVAAVRKDLVAKGDVTESVTRTDSKGRQQPAAKPKKGRKKAPKKSAIVTKAEQAAAARSIIAAAEGAQTKAVCKQIELIPTPAPAAEPSDSAGPLAVLIAKLNAGTLQDLLEDAVEHSVSNTDLLRLGQAFTRFANTGKVRPDA